MFANRGDRIEHALWMINRYNLPGGCDVAVVHIGGNNISYNCNPKKIAKGMKKVATQLTKNNKETLVLLTGILPGKNKDIHVLSKVNHHLENITRKDYKNIYYQKPDFSLWLDDKGHLKEELYIPDRLHYSKAGNELFARYVAQISQLSEKFTQNCAVPYVPPIRDATVRYGITEPYIFYSTDSDPGVARGPWYKKQRPVPPPLFNHGPCTPSSSKSGVAKSIGLPGTRVVNHLGGSVVQGSVL